MDIRKQYMRRAKEIIGDRTPAEEAYDDEVLRGLRAGADIRLAITSANAMYPAEALTVDDTNAGDVAAHYEYLMEHEKILMMSAARSPKPPSPRAPDKNETMAGDNLAVLRRIDGSNLDKTALIATCAQLDGRIVCTGAKTKEIVGQGGREARRGSERTRPRDGKGKYWHRERR
jgi:hypothetical protein